mmetsp:Transcript_34413/g.31114  ORF Transcript_34413/g.31114 Transcript_34413/m.31114 type:complete len:271 (-) Transcript_34413:202-1014(-)
MHVYDEITSHNNIFDGLEVNGSESASNFRVLRFMDHLEYKNSEENNIYVESGDIVKIIHKRTGKVLSINSRNLEPMISVKEVLFKNDIDETSRMRFDCKFMDMSKLAPPNVKLANFHKYDIGELWEIQRVNTLKAGFVNSGESVRIKNISSGLFLYEEENDPGHLHLTPNGRRKECFFKIKPKGSRDNQGRIKYNSLLKIKNEYELYLQEAFEGDHIFGSKQIDDTKLLFTLQFANETVAGAGKRLASLHPSLLKFYVFLQNWGIIAKPY